ncbi:MAG: 50S ribosomal protein L4 [Elusimicrobiota bacterium]|nr:50S ribosomal protein L4 [Elusimicrobiota bacterium]
MELSLKSIEGKDLGKIDFLSNIDLTNDINTSVVHECIVNYLANQRQGSANTKTRAEVSGGGKKPWKQKGTGRARSGSNSSPLWRHGGVVFGPKPRDYSYSIPEKKKRKGFLYALILKYKNDQIVAIDTFQNQNIEKTKQVAQILNQLNLLGRSLFVINEKQEKFIRATKNLPNVDLVYINNMNIYNIMNCEKLILDKKSIEFLNKKFEDGK